MKTSKDADKQALEVATTISPEAKFAATQAILAEGDPEVTEVLRDRRDETFALVKRLLASAGIGARFSMSNENEEVDVELPKETGEFSPEILDDCLKGLEQDFYKRGIVVINKDGYVDSFKSQLEKNRSAGTNWKTIKERLLANDKKLLKKASTMQRKGELIGVFENGELCIVDRSGYNGHREPVYMDFDAQKNLIIRTLDTPYEERASQDTSGGGANYFEIREAVIKDGFTLPDASEYGEEKRGIVAAVEAVSGKPFVSHECENYSICVPLEYGDYSDWERRPQNERNVSMVKFYGRGDTVIEHENPFKRWGMVVRVLRG